VYSTSESQDSIDNLTIDKMRKVYKNKKYYPELSKVIRFAGVPLKYAREHFGEEVNLIDVFTILGEMEAAFAKAAAQETTTAAPKTKKPLPLANKQDIETEIPEDSEAFKGRYGVSAEGEDFENLYITDEENGQENSDKEDKAEQKIEVKTEEELNDEAEEQSEDTDEATDEKEDATAQAKTPVRRGRKPTKSSSARKKTRGRPKSK